MVTVPNCIFCDQPFGPGRRRSQEHAAPQWCAELLPDLGPALHGHIRITAGGREDRDLGERDPFTTVCGDVCEPCNTGWMHELEESAKWILRPLLQGVSRNHRHWRQTLCATWAAKTAMVWDSVIPQHHVIPRGVLHTFHQTQRLSLRQQVWTGRYLGAQPHHSYRETAAHVVGPVVSGLEDPQEAHAYLTMVTVGQVAYLMFGHVLGVPHTHVLPRALERKLVQIWPPGQEVVSWPPPDTLDDHDVKTALVSLGLPIDGEGGNLIVDSP